MRRFDQEVSAPAFKEAVRETPDHMVNMLAIVPLSIGVGLTVLIGAALICWGFQAPARAALGAGGAVMIAAVLFSFWRLWADNIIWTVETITGYDLNQDGSIGTPETRLVSIEITSPDDNNLQYLQIPEALFQKLPMIAHLMTAGKPFSLGSMTGTGRPLSRSEFHQLRDVLFDRGLATWRNPDHPTSGVELTVRGKNVMRQMAELSTTPPRIPTQGAQKALPPGVGEWGHND